jgi:sulfide:quinone oxidoreductase
MTTAAHRVVIAGGGVAGLEGLVALRRLAGDRVATTLLAPDERFVLRALSVRSPFTESPAETYDLESIAVDQEARFVRDRLDGVDVARQVVRTSGGDELPYDALLVAVGARPARLYADALTFRGFQDADAMRRLLADVEAGRASRLAFVVPPGVSWPLPLYELALMTAERAEVLGLDVALSVLTPEPRPLGLFGAEASLLVDRVLRERGVAVRTHCHVRDLDGGTVFGAYRHVEARAERVVALPRLHGPALRGLPSDGDGFLPVDEHGRVRGAEGVYGAGDGTTVLVKQGGIAAQQADAAARAIASASGAAVTAGAFRPVLRAQLLAGSRSAYLRQAVGAAAGSEPAGPSTSGEPLWWPPTKVVAPYLTPYLEELRAAPST